VFEKNSNVRRLVEEASADGVRLDPASYLGDLVEDNFGFLISKLREKCWTGEGIRKRAGLPDTCRGSVNGRVEYPGQRRHSASEHPADGGHGA
jgi:hypothetical protein